MNRGEEGEEIRDLNCMQKFDFQMDKRYSKSYLNNVEWSKQGSYWCITSVCATGME